MKLRRKHKEEAELHVGPLNDILFILLFFFLIASTFAGLNAVRVNLPKGKSDTKVAQRFVVTLDSSNNMSFNTKRIQGDSLANELRNAYLKDTTVKDVVFNGDVKTNYGAFVNVLMVAKKMGLKVSVNVSQQQDEPPAGR
jgi:biopolymer transport protein ExbD